MKSIDSIIDIFEKGHIDAEEKYQKYKKDYFHFKYGEYLKYVVKNILDFKYGYDSKDIPFGSCGIEARLSKDEALASGLDYIPSRYNRRLNEDITRDIVRELNDSKLSDEFAFFSSYDRIEELIEEGIVDESIFSQEDIDRFNLNVISRVYWIRKE